jgi:3-oxoadipate enol-lactonase
MPTVRHRDVAIHYECYGEGPPLVFLHPLSLNRYHWTHQIFAFARRHRVVVVDLRGHGLSSRPDDGYAIDRMTADLEAVMDDAAIDRAVLVGNSAGAMIAVQAALDLPARVRAAMLVSVGTNLGAIVPPAVLLAYEQRFEAAFDFMIGGALAIKTKRERPWVEAFLRDVYRARGNFDREVFLGCVRDPNGVFGWDVSGRLGEIRLPVHVVAGAEDQAVPLDAVRRLAAAIPSAKLQVVDDVGHFYPLEHPLSFNEELAAFLRSV